MVNPPTLKVGIKGQSNGLKQMLDMTFEEIVEKQQGKKDELLTLLDKFFSEYRQMKTKYNELLDNQEKFMQLSDGEDNVLDVVVKDVKEKLEKIND